MTMTDQSATAKVVKVHPAPSCENCHVRRLCLPVSLGGDELNTMEQMVKSHGVLKSNAYIFRAGDQFKSLYAIKTGAVKTYGLTSDGKEQITGFHLPGELVGMDAIGNHVHNCNAVTLENTAVCELPFGDLETISQVIPRLQHELACIMSREILSEGTMLLMIGKMSAEQRLACFLQNIYQRMRLRGGEENVIRLPMSREDIGNYLGLTLETISRRLGILQSGGIIQIEKRNIRILDPATLGKICSS